LENGCADKKRNDQNCHEVSHGISHDGTSSVSLRGIVGAKPPHLEEGKIA